MSCAFVVLAHRGPEQVERLATRLRPHPVLLHVDAGVDSGTSTALAHAAAHTGATLLPRHRSTWASWGIVAAVLEGMRAALGRDDWSHLMVLSGQDYPLAPAADIGAFLDAHTDTSFMARWALPNPLWGRDGGMYRLRCGCRGTSSPSAARCTSASAAPPRPKPCTSSSADPRLRASTAAAGFRTRCSSRPR
jgi:hypothetical protein